jgi:predicted metal-dependent enzyme (double-stranded beta helix superfamily)
MLTRGYGLDEFVHDMEALLETGAEQGHTFAQGAAWLERLIQNPECIPPEYRVPVGKGPRPNHGSYVLHRSPNGLLVTAVVWGPGDHTGPHDHHTWGMIGVMNNTLQETRFRRLDDGSRPDHARLEKDRVSFFKPGEVSLLIPGVDEIHQMDNPSDRPTVEIHVYGKDLAGLQRCRFNAETGSVRPFMTEKYDNE